MKNRIVATLKAFSECDSGLTVVEYALLGGLIAAVAIPTITTLGTNVNAKLSALAVAIP